MRLRKEVKHLIFNFATSRIDSCCCLLAGLPLGTLARLDRVLRSAARLVGGGCPSFLPSLPTCVMYYIGSLFLSGYSIVSLQWSPVVSFSPLPLTFATSVSVMAARRVLRSATKGELLVPWARLAIMQLGSFRLWA